VSFEEAVRAAPAPVDRAYRSGKRALAREYRSRVACAEPRRLTGSIDLDSALSSEPGYANAPRWDYGIGYKPRCAEERAIWIEVHPASTSNVREVISKANWLRTWLRENAPPLALLTIGDGPIRPFVWIATARVHIPRNSPQARQLAIAGLDMPRKALRLP